MAGVFALNDFLNLLQQKVNLPQTALRSIFKPEMPNYGRYGHGYYTNEHRGNTVMKDYFRTKYDTGPYVYSGMVLDDAARENLDISCNSSTFPPVCFEAFLNSIDDVCNYRLFIKTMDALIDELKQGITNASGIFDTEYQYREFYVKEETKLKASLAQLKKHLNFVRDNMEYLDAISAWFNDRRFYIRTWNCKSDRKVYDFLHSLYGERWWMKEIDDLFTDDLKDEKVLKFFDNIFWVEKEDAIESVNKYGKELPEWLECYASSDMSIKLDLKFFRNYVFKEKPKYFKVLFTYFYLLHTFYFMTRFDLYIVLKYRLSNFYLGINGIQQQKVATFCGKLENLFEKRFLSNSAKEKPVPEHYENVKKKVVAVLSMNGSTDATYITSSFVLEKNLIYLRSSLCNENKSYFMKTVYEIAQYQKLAIVQTFLDKGNSICITDKTYTSLLLDNMSDIFDPILKSEDPVKELMTRISQARQTDQDLKVVNHMAREVVARGIYQRTHSYTTDIPFNDRLGEYISSVNIFLKSKIDRDIIGQSGSWSYSDKVLQRNRNDVDKAFENYEKIYTEVLPKVLEETGCKYYIFDNDVEDLDEYIMDQFTKIGKDIVRECLYERGEKEFPFNIKIINTIQGLKKC